MGSILVSIIAWVLLAAVLAGLAEPWAAPLDLVSSFRLHLGVLAIILAVVALGVGAGWASAIAAGTALLALSTVGPVWQSPERPGPEGGQPLRVLFANVYIENSDPTALQHSLIAHDADVIVVAEGPGGFVTDSDVIDRAYPHRATGADWRGRVRTGLWSRLPIERQEVNLNDNHAPLAAGAVLRLGDGARVSVLGAHFLKAQSRAVSEAQIGGLARLAGRLGPPLVLVGDFNASIWSNRVADTGSGTGTIVAGGYRQTWRGRYPLGLPSIAGHQIDHLLTSPEVGVTALRTVDIPGSDHRGLLADLVVPAGTAATVATADLSGSQARDYLGADQN